MVAKVVRTSTSVISKKFSSLFLVYVPPVPPTEGGGGATGAVCPGPQCKGAPKQCRTCSNKIRSSVTFQSSFWVGFAVFRVKSVCSYALRFMLLTHNYLSWLLRYPLPRAPYVVLFDLKPLIEDGNLQVYICIVCMHEKSLRSPQNTLQSM